MKKIYLFIILQSVFLFGMNAQTWEWTKPEPNGSLGANSEHDEAHDIEIDANGNAYVLGNFKGSLYLNNSFITTGGGSYLAKYDNTGTLLWYQLIVPNFTNINGYEESISATDLAITSQGVFITGKYTSTGNGGYYYDCNTGQGSGPIYSYSIGNYSFTSQHTEGGFFVARLNSNGEVIWNKVLTGEYCFSDGYKASVSSPRYNPLITRDNDDNIICEFLYPHDDAKRTSITIGTGTIPLPPAIQNNNGDAALIVFKMNDAGTLQWSNYAYNTAQPYTLSDCNSIITDNNGNVFLYGRANNGYAFSDQVFSSTGINGWSAFIAKISSNGAWQFVKELGTNIQNILSQGVGNPDYLAVDNLNNLYALVNFRGSGYSETLFGDIIYTFETNTYLVKMDNDGNLVDKKGFGTNDTYANGVAFANNSLYITGGIRNYTYGGKPWYFSNLTVEPSSQNYGAPIEYFVSKANTNGDFQWSTSFSGQYDVMEGFTVKVVDDNVYTAGYYRGLITTLGNLNGSYSTYNSTANLFFGKLKDQNIRVGTITPTTVCPGGTFTIPFTSYGLILSNNNSFTAQLSDANGSFANTTNIGSVISTGTGSITATVPNLPNGTTGYRIRIKSSDLLNTGFPYYTYADINYVMTIGQQIFYQDLDGDGFGNAAVSVTTCPQPAGYATNNTDCDDSKTGVHPGATEVCNGIDDNCDGNIDEGLTLHTYYQDNDGDGFGSSVSTQSCSQPPGYVSAGGDCNDNNAAINSNAVEICGNSIDDNCNGQVDEGCTIPTQISINDITVYESQGVATLTISLSKISAQAIKINYNTVDGTALSKGKGKNPIVDYVALRGTLTIPAGSLSGTVNVTIVNDGLAESAEYFDMQLSIAKNVNAAISDGSGRVTILDGLAPLTSSEITTSAKYNDGAKISGLTETFVVKLLPNPSKNYFTLTIRTNDISPIVVRIMDVLGRVVIMRNNVVAGNLVVGSDLNAGVYMAEIVQGSNRKLIKLVKQ